MHHTRYRIGFTLVELLVVIGIIALLVSILLPSLNKARRSAQTAACLSNLRQVGLGIFMYAADNRDQLPAGQWENWYPGDDARWYTLINPYMGGEGNTVKTAQLDTPEQTLTKALLCPGAAIAAGHVHFSSNPVTMGRRDDFNKGMPHLKITQLRPSSRIMLAWDGNQQTNPSSPFYGNPQTVAFMTDSSIPAWAVGRPPNRDISSNQRYRNLPLDTNRDGTSNTDRGRIRWRHGNNNAVNAIFADGHAATHQQGTLTNNNTFPDGWRTRP